MLAAWFRMKYSSLVTGAIAASAPIFQFEQLTPCDAYNRILSSVFKTELDANCAKNIKKSWPLLKYIYWDFYCSNLTNINIFIFSRSKFTTQDGRNELVNYFKMCKKNLTEGDHDDFIQYLSDVYGNLAMVNYPYPSKFLSDLPAYPVREFCGQLREEYNDTTLLPALSRAVQVYWNYNGNGTCLDFASAYNENMGSKGWEFQACTEMVMPSCSTGITDMFYQESWDLKKFSDSCFKKFGVRPREHAAITYYGDKTLA